MPSIHRELDERSLARVTAILRQPQDESYLCTEELKAVVDNGASDAFVAPGMLESCSFKPIVPGACRSPRYSGGPREYQTEVLVLNAGDDALWIPVKAIEWVMPFPDCALVLGTSFLRRCVFLFNGIHNTFTLTWGSPND